ncbi:MAG: hypothetical protein F6J97_13770 [Leptolyngbya sp. SIO4C1]|nr:hypothetical protein [Leptolyngbya sp. SIO4C1]
MAPQTSDSTPSKSAPAESLRPELKSVLDSLDVHLEDELSRYRRQLRGQAPPPNRSKLKSQKPALDLIAVKAQPSPEAASPPAAPVQPPPAPPNPFLKDLPAAADSETAAAPSEPAKPDLPVHQSSELPESYLESSEELLKNLADDPVGTAPPKPYRPGRLSRLTTPLGMGLLLLLVVSSVGLGYLILNPAVIDSIRARWQTSTATSDTPLGEDAQPEGEFEPPGPDLSTQEFVELDLESLSTLDVDGATPPAASAPAAPAPPAIAPSPDPLPAPAAQPAQAPPSPQAAPSSEPLSPTSSASSPAVGSNYYVVINYTGDDALLKTREVVSDAFVRNFAAGARIQLGAFDNAETAQQFVQELQQQGLSSQVYGPTDE